MSQTEQQRITINILQDISKNKSYQAMKFCQLIQYNVRKIFLQSHAENKAVFQFLKKALSGRYLNFNIFW